MRVRKRDEFMEFWENVFDENRGRIQMSLIGPPIRPVSGEHSCTVKWKSCTVSDRTVNGPSDRRAKV